MNLSELKTKSMPELMDIASGYQIENLSGLRKQELIFALLQACASQNGSEDFVRIDAACRDFETAAEDLGTQRHYLDILEKMENKYPVA